MAQLVPNATDGKLRVAKPSVLLVGLALVDFVAHMLVSGNYGYFRDELYYIEAGRHLSFGYVDFPPLIALLAKLLDVFAGDALWAIHIVPALATALIVVITGLIARELGEGASPRSLRAWLASWPSRSWLPARSFRWTRWTSCGGLWPPT